MAISITEPISRAIERAKLITFQPFNIGKWFSLGFVAFLASLGEGGGGANFRAPTSFTSTRPAPPAPPAPMPFPMPGRSPTVTAPGSDSFNDFWHWITANLAISIVITAVVALFILAIWLTLLWISSRGKFMFLEAVARNTAQVVEPWKRYRELGNSLFAFRAGLTVIGMLVMLIAACVALALAWTDIQAKTFGGGALAAILVGAALLIPLSLVLALIGWATDTFVSMIMYATGQSVMPAWSEFRRDVLPGNIGSFVLFLLMQIVLAIAIALAGAMIGCITCCIGALPYLSSVITLPLSVFMRSYSIYFLQQFSPRYVIIEEQVPPPPTYGFPVIPIPPQAPPPLPPESNSQ